MKIILLPGCEEYDVQREKEQREDELAMHNCFATIFLHLIVYMCIIKYNLTLSVDFVNEELRRNTKID
ncbi:hypothetical protein T4A_8844 [Trichinella pseudospiralis]|uniref:Uncharacterized protein n=1 Tax=Trichinella pseudospiralis TaxID=6337 RepID=A0A0V1ENL0_TRIPS|nr:hypothetical protein T4A_8844 [Trichinella pseudospiralis]